MVFTTAQFQSQFGRLHDSIYHNDPYATTFKAAGWKSRELPWGFYFPRPMFAALVAVAKMCSERQLVITSPETQPPHEFNELIGLSYDEYTRIRCTTIGHFQIHLFGASGKWGMICSNEDEESFFGAEPEVFCTARPWIERAFTEQE